MSIDIRLLVDGVRIADGSPGEDPAAPYAVEGLQVTWGRATTSDQPAASTCTFTVLAVQALVVGLFADQFRLGRRVDVDAGWLVHNEWTKQGRVFTGVITDVSMTTPDGDPTMLMVEVAADDLLADLANRPAAATPWPKETVTARVNHVLTAARLNTGILIASDLAGVLLRKTDNDSGTAADMLQNIAVSTDGVLWPVAYLSDPGLWLESPVNRAPLRRLKYVPPWVVIVDVALAAGALPIGSCVPDITLLEWRQTMSDLTTSVEVKYYTPDPTDGTQPDIDNVVLVVDPGAESPSQPWGVRRYELDSLLTSLNDASAVGNKILGRLSDRTWRLSGVTVAGHDMADLDMIQLVDSQKRTGLPVTLAPLPAWAPSTDSVFAGYVEGGDLTYQVGEWTASLWLSAAQGGIGQSGRWVDLPNPDLTARWTNSSSGSPTAAGLFRYASGSKVLMPNIVDLDGVNQTTILQAITPGDLVSVYAASTGAYWTATVVTNTFRPGTDAQLAVTSETGTMPALGVTAELSFTPAGDVSGPWRWSDIEPSIQWSDLASVAGPVAGT